jgi:HK97 family phage prohead protease
MGTTRLTRRSDNPQVFEGFACVYGKPHMYKGGIEVFVRGCFNHTLSTKAAVRFLIDHDASVCLGDTDNNLELVESDIGLAFKIRLQPGDIERLNGREQLSVGYTETEVETRSIEGDDVRLIKSVLLAEISACHSGAVKQTHGVVRDADSTGRLQDDAKHTFPSDSAWAALQRALRKLQNERS